MLWNFTTPGTITVWGTVYAPGAALADRSDANIGGAVVRSLVHGGTVGGSGGEIHYAPFEDAVTCGSTTTTTTDGLTAPTTTSVGQGPVERPDELAGTGARVGGPVLLGGALVVAGAALPALARHPRPFPRPGDVPGRRGRAFGRNRGTRWP
ncbi:hypothetical protein [Saccharothrix syringae]|uniref:Uncharacterized protein n=1 Tax=Saccharothrix syringae TaxID=103733 RepID=A0A5Q0HBH9_SACSY|nr:hypothetical protein [Saccharothrix syringae]QFZ23305.1 hypothetical protein EKG83_42965 [Saccharothrix syringae]